MKVILTEDQLNERAAYWQKVLGLQDWDVQVKKARAEAFDGDREGECEYLSNSKTARIRILDESHYPTDAWDEQDMELTLVHELLHLHFSAIRDLAYELDHYVMFEEQAINKMSQALVHLERTNKAER
ncbi:hypothetical protein ACM26V_00025 [Salipaludibacillus sp. HK11]|uniref:hypothetical protein n=1 Tax=Salipaludibacillus sp. HK11 TaxID=3394320 RepID=UPI0039FC6016